MSADRPELTYLEGETLCSYTWSTGEIIGAFLEALRDRGKILGALCGGCGTVAVPPLSYCESCGSSVRDWREVGPLGVVTSWARVAGPHDGAPVEAPFRYVLVRLAGADTSMLHVAPDDEKVRTGATVVPEFRKVRTGSITDIKWFVPEGSEPAEKKKKRERYNIEAARVAAGGGQVTEVDGELRLSYRYSYGEHYERFYREMRDNRRIMGIRCSRCGAVLLPPRPYCGFCFEPAEEWVEVSDEGTLVTYTVAYPPSAGQPAEPPRTYAFIMLDGADVQFPHLLGEVSAGDIEVGMRVKAVWAEDRKGTLHDIEYFRPL